jgi:hypothetical protein
MTVSISTHAIAEIGSLEDAIEAIPLCAASGECFLPTLFQITILDPSQLVFSAADVGDRWFCTQQTFIGSMVVPKVLSSKETFLLKDIEGYDTNMRTPRAVGFGRTPETRSFHLGPPSGRMKVELLRHLDLNRSTLRRVSMAAVETIIASSPPPTTPSTDTLTEYEFAPTLNPPLPPLWFEMC